MNRFLERMFQYTYIILAHLFAFLLIGLFITSPAYPEVIADNTEKNCVPSEELKNQLAKTFGEQLHGIFIMADGGALVVLMNKETQTWTLAEVYPDGSSCVRAWGSASVWNELGIDVGEPA